MKNEYTYQQTEPCRGIICRQRLFIKGYNPNRTSTYHSQCADCRLDKKGWNEAIKVEKLICSLHHRKRTGLSTFVNSNYDKTVNIQEMWDILKPFFLQTTKYAKQYKDGTTYTQQGVL